VVSIEFDLLREKALYLNKEIYNRKLVHFTWGNASIIDRENNVVAIKPSGIDFESIRKEDIVVTDLEGNVIYGDKKPSVDLKTHLTLYKYFSEINSIIHMHSKYATAYAQSSRKIKCLGTTHADYFFGDIPVTRYLDKDEIKDYEKNTGKLIVETFKKRKLDYKKVSACLVRGHGVFVWSNDANACLRKAEILEFIAEMNFLTEVLNKLKNSKLPKHLMIKHYYRMNGANRYYGQNR
jgi:L-ribulose-5-phosphate 4-epimerase